MDKHTQIYTCACVYLKDKGLYWYWNTLHVQSNLSAMEFLYSGSREDPGHHL